ncbi:hypothetical protein ACQKL5_19500 [Peribacillus sp. NPDC097675]|uniref:hypothetical protein n=1 Tax=Peribacillus sp. NPDC097675 TaxID=3390618 RepID=UPI003CFCBCFA
MSVPPPKKFLLVFLMCLLMAGCSGNEGQIEKAVKATVSVFRNEALQPNTEVGRIKVNLPKKFKIEEEHDNNLILKRGNQAYILFVNPNENSDSSRLFLTAKEQQTDYLVLESFQTDDKFGFLSIIESAEEKYELAVGSGGVKMTTETSSENLKKEAEKMMKIVSSVPQK